MKIKFDYHVHSVYSKNKHGKSTIEENVQKAIELGLEEIAITDHGPRHFLFGIKNKNIKKAKEEIVELRKKYPNIKILYGIEANILNFQGDIDVKPEDLEVYDIVLCGYHMGVLFSTFKDFWAFIVLNYLSKFSKKLRKRQKERNTKAIVNALYKNNIYILTHPGDKIPVDIDKIAYAAQENNTILEINSSHNHLNAEEIIIASKYDVNFAIGSDSHIKDNIGNFENALKELEKAGIDLRRVVNIA